MITLVLFTTLLSLAVSRPYADLAHHKSHIAYSVQPVCDPASSLPGDVERAKAKPREMGAQLGLCLCCNVRESARRLVSGRPHELDFFCRDSENFEPKKSIYDVIEIRLQAGSCVVGRGLERDRELSRRAKRVGESF